MIEALGQSQHLDIQNLLTRGLHICLLWNEGVGIDVTDQFEIARLHRLGNDLMRCSLTLGIDERGVMPPLCTQTLHIHLCYLDLRL